MPIRKDLQIYFFLMSSKCSINIKILKGSVNKFSVYFEKFETFYHVQNFYLQTHLRYFKIDMFFKERFRLLYT